MQGAQKLPVSLVAINFRCDENLAFLIRTAACFGASTLYVIGSVPSRKEMFNSSGSLVDFMDLIQFSTPRDFLDYARENKLKLVSAELTDDAVNLYEYEFGRSEHTAIILGNEATGVPVELLVNSDVVYIPMPGLGFCLNTSQTGTAMISEYARQYFKKDG